jgi:hypothetical protein
VKCAYNNKGIIQKSSFNKGVDTAVENYMLIAISVLCDKFGFGGRVRIPKFVQEVVERSENINQGYVTLDDIREQLYKEHKIILDMKRGSNNDS